MDSRFKKKESLASVSAIYREYKLKERILETKLKEYEDKLQTELVVHTETREFFSRKLITMQEEISKWDGKYEKEVGMKDDEIKDISSRRRKLLEGLSILQNRKNLEIFSVSKEKEKNQQIAEEMKRSKDLLKKQNRASRVIVREMRAYIKFKKEMEALKGKGKKDKKGGKDKKGKKK